MWVCPVTATKLLAGVKLNLANWARVKAYWVDMIVHFNEFYIYSVLTTGSVTVLNSYIADEVSPLRTQLSLFQFLSFIH